MTDSDQYLGVVGVFFNKTKNMVGRFANCFGVIVSNFKVPRYHKNNID